jgi:uncharacterized protein YsxB (DUF464 family)
MMTVIYAERGRRLSLLIEGHAGYAEQGEDIVCASASILAYTLASLVESFGVEHNIRLDEGDSVIECECPDPKKFTDVKNAYDFTNVGFALLQQSYPQYVSLLDFT